MPPKESAMVRKPGEPMFIVEPQAIHTHTLVLLHGLGSNGEKFGRELLDTGMTSSKSKLSELLPGARFVFPTSKPRRSSAFGRSMLTQWFDITCLEDPSVQRYRQLQGLAESAQEIMQILTEELKRVPPENVILGGLSQGCAMSLAVLLCLEHPIGGYIGMSGYLTYEEDLEIALRDDEFGDDDPFSGESHAEKDVHEHPSVQAQTFERDLLDLASLDQPTSDKTASRTPVLIGHGSMDEKVPVALGKGVVRSLQNAGYQVDWKCYEGQGHWYKIPEQIDDIVNFIVSRVGWKVNSDSMSAAITHAE